MLQNERTLSVIKPLALDDFLATGGIVALAHIITDVGRDKYMSHFNGEEKQDLAVAELVLADFMENAMARITQNRHPHVPRAEHVAWALDTVEHAGMGNASDVDAVRTGLRLQKVEGWIGESAKRTYLSKINTKGLDEGLCAG